MSQKKFEKFINEPIFLKKCSDIPGIGEAIAKKLELNGFTKATQLLGMLLILKKDSAAFISWLCDLSSIRIDHAQKVQQCLLEIIEKFV